MPACPGALIWIFFLFVVPNLSSLQCLRFTPRPTHAATALASLQEAGPIVLPASLMPIGVSWRLTALRPSTMALINTVHFAPIAMQTSNPTRTYTDPTVDKSTSNPALIYIDLTVDDHQVPPPQVVPLTRLASGAAFATKV
jgi:hypothetical protein